MKIRRNIQISLSLAMIFALLMVGASVAAPVDGIIIDHFDEAQTLTVTAATGSGSSFAAAASAIGGERDIVVSGVSGSPSTNSVTVETNPGGNSLLSVSYQSGITANVQFQWDGPDGADTFNRSGLGSIDLTQNGQDRFVLGVTSTDLSFDLTLQVHQSTNCSESTVTIPAGITSPQIVEVPYSSFTDCAGAAVSFADVGAILMNISGVPSMDFQLHFVQAVSPTYLDFGDAPDSYGTLLASDGPRHSLTDDIYLGASDDAEADGTDSPTASAHGDDDGVTPLGNWSDGFGNVSVTVSGSEPGCLSAWVDLNMDGDFNDPGDLVVDRLSVAAGTHPISFAVTPGTVDDTDVFARFRIVPDTLSPACVDDPVIQPIGLRFGGEVEDYNWLFNPTAIELQSLDARSNPSNITAFAVAGLVLVLSAGLFVAFTRRKRSI